MPRAGRTAVVATLAALVLACATTPSACTDAAFTPSAELALAGAVAQLDFTPKRPCTFDQASTVTAVFVDMLPGAPPRPRLNLVVTRRGEQAFIFSQTRAELPFSAIPQSTHRVRIRAGDTTADGFAGPSGIGVDTMYIRWRIREVTFELDATLRPWLTERDLGAIASALIRVNRA